MAGGFPCRTVLVLFVFLCIDCHLTNAATLAKHKSDSDTPMQHGTGSQSSLNAKDVKSAEVKELRQRIQMQTEWGAEGLGLNEALVASKDVFSILLFSVMVVVGVAWDGWGIKPRGITTSHQTEVHIVFAWLDFIGTVLSMIIMFTAIMVSFYTKNKQITVFDREDPPDTDLAPGHCYDILKPFVKSSTLSNFLVVCSGNTASILKTDEQLLKECEKAKGNCDQLKNELDALGGHKMLMEQHFVDLNLQGLLNSSLNEQQADALKAEVLKSASATEKSIEGRVLSEEEWTSYEQDTVQVDKLRVLIKCFQYDDAEKSVCDSQDPEDNMCSNKRALLHAAYMFKKQTLDSNNPARDPALLSKRYDLKRQLEIPWARLSDFVMRYEKLQDKNEDLKTRLSDAESLSLKILLLASFRANLFSFTNTLPECPKLMGNLGSSATDYRPVFNAVDYFYKGHDHVEGINLIPMYHAKAWECTHGARTTMKESATCELTCEKGYSPRRGITICDKLGGGGIWWSHLNANVNHADVDAEVKGSTLLDQAACCTATPDAPWFVNNTASLTWTDTASSAYINVAFWNTTAFAHSCSQGYGQHFLQLELCYYGGSGNYAAECNEICGDYSSNGKVDSSYCRSYQTDLQGKWDDSEEIGTDLKLKKSSIVFNVPAEDSRYTNFFNSVQGSNFSGTNWASKWGTSVDFDLGTGIESGDFLDSNYYIRLGYYAAGEYVKGPWRDWSEAEATANTYASVHQARRAARNAKMLQRQADAEVQSTRAAATGGDTNAPGTLEYAAKHAQDAKVGQAELVPKQPGMVAMEMIEQ